jgi:hypothetical protein
MADLVAVIAPAALALFAVRFVLLVWPSRRAKLRDPRTVPDMPMAGAASVKAAHRALSRRGKTARPKFRT